MKPIKYHWPGVGTMKIVFQKVSGGHNAIVRFDSALLEGGCKGESTQVSRTSIRKDIQHSETRQTPPRGGKKPK